MTVEQLADRIARMVPGTSVQHHGDTIYIHYDGSLLYERPGKLAGLQLEISRALLLELEEEVTRRARHIRDTYLAR